MSHQFGQRNVVAALGTAITTDHVRMLRRVADQMVVLTDSDAAGARAAERSLEMLFQEGEDEETRIVRLPGEAKDPCDFLLAFGAEPFVAALKEGQTLFDYKFRRVVAGHDIGTPGGQAAAAKELMALVSLSPDPQRRAAYRCEVASRLKLPENSLTFAPRKTVNVAAGEGTGSAAVPEPVNAVGRAERGLLRWLFHQPAFIEAAVGDVDLTAFRGTGERLIGKAVLAAVDAGRLPPDLKNLSPDTHSLSGIVAREVLAGLSEDADLFEGGKLVKEEDLAQARSLCVELAEEGFEFKKRNPDEQYGALIEELLGSRLDGELEDAKRAVAAARARGDSQEIAEAEKREQEALLAVGRSARRRPRRAKVFFGG
jgi:DNA primase